ncbi:thiamine pyrophosphate-binding protein [Paenibacillus sambharensis]|uniref:Thiamine pyrophosphate-binding protein n=1 Tax=Paenibacillus sambharensis TaxID=1803190 RepID=A0A2W1M0B2_9BACL|nr:thiamine pyrophosphate-binding protein [Paenibacillus sambharensis]PZD97167.1 thiamine pyrophosphate-binding protein [Paenibacillus sambharensis]
MPDLLQERTDKQQPVNADMKMPDLGLTVADYILKLLVNWGISRIYGVIGDANLLLLDAISRQRDIRYIPFLDENAAALAASADAKLSGGVGAVIGTSGPGLVNMLNGLGDAFADRVGVLAITGQVDAPKIGLHTKQYVQQQLTVAPLAAFSELLAHPDALPGLLQHCLIMSSLQGAVTHLSIPKLMFAEKVKGAVLPYSAHLHQPLLAPEKEVEEVFHLMAAAIRPMLLIGGGVYGAEPDTKVFAEEMGAAVATTMPAKHLFPNSHPLYAGGLGLAGSEATSLLMRESDLIIILGATWWPEEFTPQGVNMIQIDAARENIGIGHGLLRGLVGDLRDIMPRLASMAKRRKKNEEAKSAWKQRISEVRNVWSERLEQETTQAGSPLAPQRIMRDLSESIPGNAIIAVDTGDHSIWFNRCFDNRGQRLLLSGRWRTLGFALPAAIAAKHAFPDQPVVAIAGDGGVVQTIMELKTAAAQSIPLVLVVINNNAYAIEKNRMELTGLDTIGSKLDNPDFVRLAEALGGIGFRAHTSEELRSCMEKALQSDKPVLIDVSASSPTVPHSKI